MRRLALLAAAALALASACGAPPRSTTPRQPPPADKVPLAPEEDDPVARAAKLWTAGKTDEAARELERAISKEPDNARARYLYANLLAEKGELRGAATQLELAVAKRPEDPLAWERLGEVRERLGERVPAIQAYERVAALVPRSPDPHRSIARVKLQLGDGAGALAAIDAARATADRDPLVESLAVRALLLVGDEARAVVAARQFVELAKDEPALAERSKELKAFLRARARALSAEDRSLAVELVRASFRPRLPSADAPESAVLARMGPALRGWDDRAVFVTILAPEGGPRWRGRGRGRSLAAALSGAIEAARESRGFDAELARSSAVRIDVEKGEPERVALRAAHSIPLDDGASVAVGLDAEPPIEPGLHGLAARVDDREVFCLPGDAVTEDLADVDAMLTYAARSAGVGARAWESAGAAFFRFTTESFVSPTPGAAPVELVRGEPLPFPEATPDACLDGAKDGAEYLRDAIRGEEGAFVYLYDARKDRPVEADYSEVRHAGAALLLAEAHRRTGRADFRDVAELAAAWLERRVVHVEDRALVVYKDRAKLGALALALCLFDELDVGDAKRRVELRDGLARAIASLLRPDGTFLTLAQVPGRPAPIQEPNQFFPGEAVLALVRHARATGEARWRDAAVKGADARIGEWRARARSDGTPPLDPWLARAIVELEPLAPSPERVAFALDVARAILAHQRGPETGDAAGGLAEAGELFPRGMPTSSLGEGLAAVALLARERGLPEARKLREGVRVAAAFVLRHQYGPRQAFYLASAPHARGGFRSTLTRARVRIDGVQHASSFLLLAERLLRE